MATSTDTKVIRTDVKYFKLVRIFQNNGYSNVASFHERGS